MAELRLPNINHVMLSGRLTHDPELRYTPTGRPVLNMQIASNRRYLAGDEWQDEVLYIRAVLWGPNAERLGARLAKGSAVVVEGSLTYRQWETNGQKRSTVEIRAWRVQALDKQAPETPEDTPDTATPKTEAVPDFDEGVPDEDLPF